MQGARIPDVIEVLLVLVGPKEKCMLFRLPASITGIECLTPSLTLATSFKERAKVFERVNKAWGLQCRVWSSVGPS